MAMFLDPFGERLHGPTELLRRRAPIDSHLSCSAFHPPKLEPQELERLIWFRHIPVELQRPRLFWSDCQSELAQPLGEFLLPAHCIGPILEGADKVVRIAYHEHVALALLLHSMLK